MPNGRPFTTESSAERGGFEPPVPRGHTRFRVVPFQPGSRTSPERSCVAQDGGGSHRRSDATRGQRTGVRRARGPAPPPGRRRLVHRRAPHASSADRRHRRARPRALPPREEGWRAARAARRNSRTYFAPPSWPPFISPPFASSAFGALAASSWHFFTSFSSITIVSAPSFTERPVARYLFTCLQLTAARPEPAIPSSKPAPITTIPSFMREPPCADARSS